MRIHRLGMMMSVLFPFFAAAQTDSAGQGEKITFRLGLFYNSRLNYYGRTDSLHSSGIFPVAEIGFGKHFYLNGTPVFTYNPVSRFTYAGTIVTAGYLFRNTKWAGHSYLTKPVYQSNSQLPQSALQWQAAASFSRLGRWINITGGGDIKYSNKVDFGITAGLDHLFRFEPGKSWIWVIDPSAYINAGTQHFTSTTYKKSGFFIFPGIQQEVTEKTSRFEVLSYEFSIPMVIAKGKFQFILNPAFVIPQNLVTVTGRPDLSERGKQSFYFTAGFRQGF